MRRQQERARAKQEAEERHREAAPNEAEELETALFDVDGKVLEMRVRRGATPYDIAQVWEKEWGVSYASRLRFEAPKGSGSKWLNAREDPMPTAPAEVRLSGIGSILRSVRLALAERGGAANAPPEPPPQPLDGPQCPGTFLKLPKDAKIDDDPNLVNVMRLLGVDLEKGIMFDETSDTSIGRGRKGRAKAASGEGGAQAVSAEARDAKARAAGGERGAGAGGAERSAAGDSSDSSDVEFVPPTSGRCAAVASDREAEAAEDEEAEDEEDEDPDDQPSEGAAVLLYVFGLVGFRELEAEILIAKLKLKDIKHFADIAKTQDEAQVLAKEAELLRPVQQARFAEAWRRCALHLLGQQKEYPRALTRPAYESDFAESALAYLVAVRDAMESEEFAEASRELKNNWRRRVPRPSSEEKMEELSNMCFKHVHSQLLALFGFFPDNKGRKEAQAKIRQAGKDRQEVRKLDAELMKMSMQRFEL